MNYLISKPLQAVNSLPNIKILDQSNLNDFAGNKINKTYATKFVLGKVENSVEKGENAGYQHFLLFPHCFHKPALSGLLKVRIVW